MKAVHAFVILHGITTGVLQTVKAMTAPEADPVLVKSTARMPLHQPRVASMTKPGTIAVVTGSQQAPVAPARSNPDTLTPQSRLDAELATATIQQIKQSMVALAHEEDSSDGEDDNCFNEEELLVADQQTQWDARHQANRAHHLRGQESQEHVSPLGINE